MGCIGPDSKREEKAKMEISLRHSARRVHPLGLNVIGVSLGLKTTHVVSIYAMIFYMRRFGLNQFWRSGVFLSIHRGVSVLISGARDGRRSNSIGSLTLQLSVGQHGGLL